MARRVKGRFQPPRLCVRLAPEDVADRRRDVALGKDPGGHLLEQRRKHVMVRSVDDRHVDLGPAERPGRKQAPEPRSDDYHAMPALYGGFASHEIGSRFAVVPRRCESHVRGVSRHDPE